MVALDMEMPECCGKCILHYSTYSGTEHATITLCAGPLRHSVYSKGYLTDLTIRHPGCPLKELKGDVNAH